ncbi:MAG: DUF1343 domain-containing protein [bacterium]|nr:DUF1343 domain-containing protein [bacterium]
MRRHARLVLLLLAAACSRTGAPPAPARGVPLDFSAAESAIEEAIEAGHLPGAVLLVGRGDAILHRAAYGNRRAAPVPEAMTVDTVFDLASLTKVVATATSVVKLVEDGRVRLDAPVQEYLPEFGTNGKEAITVEHLLLHRGGLIPDNSLSDYADGPAQAWERICALEPRAEPGTSFTYTDVGFIVLAALVKAVDGRALDAFAREELFEPLGMGDTTFRPGPELAARCAPTERREGRWMQGEVHDPRAFALGGVAGHAGLFSTADDLARYCQAILAGGELGGARVLTRSTVDEMTRPRWLPDRTGGRGLGFDFDTRYSSARGSFPRGTTFGHTGFTGTSFWLDPRTGSYVVLLSSRVHPDGSGNVIELRRAVASAVASALRPRHAPGPVRTGCDVLADEDAARFAGATAGLITNVTGQTREGRSTIDVLARSEHVQLAKIFSPEHGYFAALEGDVDHATDPATGLPVYSLYGDTRKPTAEMLAGIDTLVFDIQDVGTRFYTYMTTLGYAMEAAAEHGVRVVVLDRPNPITGVLTGGPSTDPERLSFIAYKPIPIVHGMTIGELALLFNAEYGGIGCELEVVQIDGWKRAMWLDETGVPWVNPSPNMRNPTQALLYPAIGLLEGANLSVGRGTDQPFEVLGAPWIDGPALADALNAARLPGLAFTSIAFTPDASKFEGERCGGVYVRVTGRDAVRPVTAGLTIAWHLGQLFGDAFEIAAVDTRMISRSTWEALVTSEDPSGLAATWSTSLADFERLRARHLLYD